MDRWTPFLLSTGVVLLAELGDKSQLMALAFAVRCRALTVLVAVMAATLVVHAASVALGAAAGVALPVGAVHSPGAGYRRPATCGSGRRATPGCTGLRKSGSTVAMYPT